LPESALYLYFQEFAYTDAVLLPSALLQALPVQFAVNSRPVPLFLLLMFTRRRLFCQQTKYPTYVTSFFMGPRSIVSRILILFCLRGLLKRRKCGREKYSQPRFSVTLIAARAEIIPSSAAVACWLKILGRRSSSSIYKARAYQCQHPNPLISQSTTLSASSDVAGQIAPIPLKRHPAPANQVSEVFAFHTLLTMAIAI